MNAQRALNNLMANVSRSELKHAFVTRSFDAEFEALGRAIDAESETPVWLAYECVCESKYLEDRHYWVYE